MALDLAPGVDPDEMLHAVVAEMRPGLSCIMLRDVPWGDPSLDYALVSLAGDERFSQQVILAVQPIVAPRWSNLDLHWIADVSVFLREPISQEALMKRLAALTYFPNIRELVAIRPARECVTPSVLDPLYDFLNPAQSGVIYAPDDEPGYLESALQQLTRCSTPWAIRRAR